jgi:hypothetical protein
MSESKLATISSGKTKKRKKKEKEKEEETENKIKGINKFGISRALKNQDARKYQGQRSYVSHHRSVKQESFHSNDPAIMLV